MGSRAAAARVSVDDGAQRTLVCGVVLWAGVVAACLWPVAASLQQGWGPDTRSTPGFGVEAGRSEARTHNPQRGSDSAARAGAARGLQCRAAGGRA